jgi:hypothetical protein
LDLTKDLFRGGSHRVKSGINSTGVESAFETYVRACIMHFKFIDLADVLQTEYADMPAPAASMPAVTAEASDDDRISDFNKLCFNPNTTKLVKIKAPTSNALEMLFMDKDKDNHTVAHNVVHNDNVSKASLAPKTRDVNLMDEQFKMKGIKTRPKRLHPKPGDE